MARERRPFRIWAGEKGKWINIGVMVYGERLPMGASIEAIRRELLAEIKATVESKFSQYPCRISPKAQVWLEG